MDCVEPATGAVYARVPDSDAADLDRAVAAATRAFPSWRATPHEARAAMMNKLADLVEARFEAFARAESIDNGKPISLARTTDIPRAIANLRNFASADTRTLHQIGRASCRERVSSPV